MAVDDIYTKSLLHFDGNITDESGKTWTAYGGAATSTAQKKFGSASLVGDSSGNSYISTADSDDFALGNSFTVDFWYYLSSGGWIYITQGGGGSPFLMFYATETYLQAARSDGTNWVVNNTYTASISTGAWHHFAACKTPTQLLLFNDGQNVGSISDASSWPGFSGDLRMQLKNCYVDELRISKGIARWTANFTPPTAPYGSTVRLCQAIGGF